MEKGEFDQLKSGDIVFFQTPSGESLRAKVVSEPKGDRVEIVLLEAGGIYVSGLKLNPLRVAIRMA